MKHIYLNLKRFDIPKSRGGVNALAPVANWAKTIVSSTQDTLTKPEFAAAEYVMFFPEAHILPAAAAKSGVQIFHQLANIVASVDESILIAACFAAEHSAATVTALADGVAQAAHAVTLQERHDQQHISAAGVFLSGTPEGQTSVSVSISRISGRCFAPS